MVDKVKVKYDATAEEIIELRRKQKDELKEAERKTLAEYLSIQERLERKLKTDEVVLELEDDLGKFKVRFNKLSAKIQDRVAQLMKVEMPTTQDPKKLDELTDELYSIIGEASLDRLDADFWKNQKEKYSNDIFLAVVVNLTNASSTPDEKYLRGINKFR